MKDSQIIVALIVVFSLLCYSGLCTVRYNVNDFVSACSEQDTVYVIDAGHGGEDGGAVAPDSTPEKDINLDIALKLSLFFDLFGIEHIMIRTDDRSVGDVTLPTIRKRKASDIMKRYEIINSYDNSALISIHQNNYPDTRYFGCQVFYSGNDKISSAFADIIQNKIRINLQPDNSRKPKESNDNIFLLFNAKRPSIMIECGFLSNSNDLMLLKDVSYQSKLSYFITASVLEFEIYKRNV